MNNYTRLHWMKHYLSGLTIQLVSGSNVTTKYSRDGTWRCQTCLSPACLHVQIASDYLAAAYAEDVSRSRSAAA